MNNYYKPLYRVIFKRTLFGNAFRSGVIGGAIPLEKEKPYLMSYKVLDTLKIKQDEDILLIEEIKYDEFKHFKEGQKKVLVFFPGGIGDVLALKPCLVKFKERYNIEELGVVSTLSDYCLIGDICTLWDYPIREEFANYYDGWINIAEISIEAKDLDLQEIFAHILKIDVPKEPPRIKVNKQIRGAVENLIVNKTKKKAGVHLKSQCHFRSIPTDYGCFVMLELVERGFDCYILGTFEQKLIFIDKKTGLYTSPPSGIYDMSGQIDALELGIAFRDAMDVLLTCDTSTLHIAAALDKPCVGLFGMTSGETRTKYYPTVEYIQGIGCGPCYKLFLQEDCPYSHCIAITNINPTYVANKVEEVYNKYAKEE